MGVVLSPASSRLLCDLMLDRTPIVDPLPYPTSEHIMTRTSCIRLLQIDAVVGDFDANLQKLTDAAETARQDGVSVLIAPELALTGYPPEDLLLRPALIDKLTASESRLCEISRGLTLMVGAPSELVHESRAWDLGNNSARPASLRNSLIVYTDGVE